MIKIEIKNRFTGRIIFEFSKKNNTIEDTIKEYIKKELEIGKSYADLRAANLRAADLNKRYLSITRIGSSNRMTTYCFDDNIIWCGCFKGTLEEFENEVNKTHKNNPKYLKEYLGAINYIKFLK